MERIENGFLSVTVSETGAELMSICSSDGREYLWQGDASFWKRRAPLLFPFVGRHEGGVYAYKGRVYGMPCHGFAPVSLFSVSGNSGESVTLMLKSDGNTKAIYPFDFSLAVRYALSGNVLKETVTVCNEGDDVMIYGIGWHPGFNVPGCFDSARISFPEAGDVKRRVFSPAALDAGADVPFALEEGNVHLRHDLFDDDAVVLSETGGRAVLTCADGCRVELRYSTPYLGLWHTTGKEAPFVCIEPWETLPGRDGEREDISRRDDLLRLGAGECRSHSVSFVF